jgi:FMN phosphatase YigB (HAD superfamily)
MPISPADRLHRPERRAPALCAAGSDGMPAGNPTRRRNPARETRPDAKLGGGGLISRANAARTLVAVWRDLGSSMQQLPLSGRVIFSDWHGVLSRDAFWASILQHSRHPLHAELKAGMASVFSRDVNTAEEWMMGRLSSVEVIEGMGIRPRARLREDFLMRRLVLDCGRMKVNTDLFDVLRGLRANATVVIATDNMDCFVSAYERARSKRRRRGQDRVTMADWAAICDDIISSSEVGALKEDPRSFFGPWLADHGLGFSDAILIDDRPANCAAFVAAGGSVIEWKMGVHDIGAAIAGFTSWLDAQDANRCQG